MFNNEINVKKAEPSFVKDSWIALVVAQVVIGAAIWYLLSKIAPFLDLPFQVSIVLMFLAVVGMLIVPSRIKTLTIRLQEIDNWLYELKDPMASIAPKSFTIHLDTEYAAADLTMLNKLSFVVGIGWLVVDYILQKSGARSRWGILCHNGTATMMIKLPLNSADQADHSRSHFAFSLFHELGHFVQKAEGSNYSEYIEVLQPLNSDKSSKAHLSFGWQTAQLSELDADLKAIKWCYLHGYFDEECFHHYQALRSNLSMNGNPCYASACVAGTFQDYASTYQYAKDEEKLREHIINILKKYSAQRIQLEKAFKAHMEQYEPLEELLPYQYRQWFRY
jgi:hypothetical protein